MTSLHLRHNCRRRKMLRSLTYGIFIIIVSISKANGDGCNITEIKADIAFILDSSTSINNTNFEIILQFVKNVSHSVTIGPNYVRVAVVKYAFGAFLEFDLDKYSTVQDVDQAVDGVQRTWGGTASHRALAKVHNYSSIVYGNTRPDVKHFVIFISDGLSNNPGATKTEAKSLRDDGIEIAAIGITNQSNEQELLDIASSRDHYSYVSDFYKLTTLTNKVLLLLCEDPEQEGVKEQGVRTSLITIILEIAIITACGIALIGGSVCCVRICCFSRGRRSDEEEEKKFQYLKERSSTFSTDRSSSPGSSLSSRTPSPTMSDNRVSPLPFPVVTKAKPLPMTDSNAFIL